MNLIGVCRIRRADQLRFVGENPEAIMPTLKAEFDGRVFVPCTPVDLAAGTRVEIILPNFPETLTAEELRLWQEIERQIAASPPHFPTVEEAMQYTRKRP